MYTSSQASRAVNPLCRPKNAGVEVPLRSKLDEHGSRHGTELSSLGRDYLRYWQVFLQPLRGEAFDLLEIGVGNGASLRTWREWFPSARLVGLDARRLIVDPPIENCVVLHGSQTDQSTLRQLVRSYRFRVIVDDGSRHAEDKIATFLSLFPWLESDSVYICAGFEQAIPLVRPDLELQGGETSTSESSLGPAWFANLGLELAAQRPKQPDEPTHLPIDTVLERATGVTLLRDSVVVTS